MLAGAAFAAAAAPAANPPNSSGRYIVQLKEGLPASVKVVGSTCSKVAVGSSCAFTPKDAKKAPSFRSGMSWRVENETSLQSVLKFGAKHSNA